MGRLRFGRKALLVSLATCALAFALGVGLYFPAPGMIVFSLR